MTLLSVENLKIAYPQSRGKKTNFSENFTPNWAVDDVSFTLQPGEKLGLVGESGCGKSTLGRAIMNLLPSQSILEGEIKFQDQSIFNLNPSQLRQFRGEVVALVFQDPMTRLDPLMTIGNHCIETLKAHQPQLSNKQAREKALEILDAVRINASRWSQYPFEFSGGMRQRVAIALALLLNPKMIIADEPTTSLDVTVASEILQELTRLCAERDLGLLLISHDLAMVGEYCDNLAVMYQGKMVEKGEIKTILHHPQHSYTKSLLKSALHILITEDQEQSDSENIVLEQKESHQTIEKIPILKVTNLKQYYSLEGGLLQQFFTKEKTVIKAVDDLNFELYQGEILGLVGESGCGKSTLSRTILQLIKPTSGIVEFMGEDLTQLSPNALREKRRMMQMIFQDPHACLNPLMKVGDSIADPLLIHKLATPKEAKNQVNLMLEKVGLTPVEDYYSRYPSDLSGGQQQRVAIARALITRPQLVICDEPVSMLDATVQTQVLELMLALKDEFNLTYFFITHDLWVARFFCDRIAVMNQGKIVELGETEAIFTNPQDPYTQKLLNAAPLLELAQF
jgi:peptide/nickel transport system ATP-binding protein